jgi:hypothetical protein
MASEKAIFLAAQYGSYGQVNFLDEVALPFSRDVHSRLTVIGVDESLDGVNVPSDLFPLAKGPTNVFGVDDAVFLGVAVFVATKLGDYALGKVLDEVFEDGVVPALKSMVRRLKGKKGTWSPSTHGEFEFRFGAWYDTDKVYVNVVAAIDSLDDMKNLESLVPTAHKSAVGWIKRDGIKDRVLTVRIVDGKIDNIPIWSNAVPK